MSNNNYYDGTKLLSMNDINGDKPEIYICTSNRSAGKTTYFNRYALNRFIKYGEKFALLYRFNYELNECADKFFKDIGTLFFKGKTMESVSRARGVFHELFLDGVSCGYAIALNNADQIKKYSHLLSDTKRIIFDEFQSETGKYCPDEIRKFISIHVSLARGQHEQVKYLPVFMIANPVTILNPYYVHMGITDRIKNDTKFLRGVGFVLEQGFNESASNAQKTSAFNRAFSNNQYLAYAAEAIYLNDNKAFVGRPKGQSRYFCTLRYLGIDYAIREFREEGIVYCDDKPDSECKMKVTVTTADHQINYVMLKRNDFILNTLRYFFEKGCFRFKDLKCKEAVLKALSY